MVGKSGRVWVVSLYDIKGMVLIVLKYMYEGVVSEDRSGDESLIGCICN